VLQFALLLLILLSCVYYHRSLFDDHHDLHNKEPYINISLQAMTTLFCYFTAALQFALLLLILLSCVYFHRSLFDDHHDLHNK